jgi:hypothetical protein
MEDKELVELLKRSRELIGELTPVYVTEDGLLIDGYHRLKAGWKRKERIKGAKGKYAASLLRLVLNAQRRKPSQEDYIQLAEILRDEFGLKPGQIAPEITKLTGIPTSTVYDNLPDEFKIKTRPKEIPTSESPEEVAPPPSSSLREYAVEAGRKGARIKTTEYEKPCPFCGNLALVRITGKIRPVMVELVKP